MKQVLFALAAMLALHACEQIEYPEIPELFVIQSFNDDVVGGATGGTYRIPEGQTGTFVFHAKAAKPVKGMEIVNVGFNDNRRSVQVQLTDEFELEMAPLDSITQVTMRLTPDYSILYDDSEYGDSPTYQLRLFMVDEMGAASRITIFIER